MNYQPTKLPVRRSLRLPWFDYSAAGACFITVCTHAKQPFFGVVRKACMVENGVGCAIRATWNHLPRRFPGVELDAFVVMPSHIHGIIILTRDTPIGVDLGPRNALPTLSQIVGAFKSLSDRTVNRGWKRHGSLWQRGYCEHIVRNEDDLSYIRRYIDTNPAFLEKDPECVPIETLDGLTTIRLNT